MQEESFHGRCVQYAPLSNGHRVRILYKTSQLEESIYPDLNRSLQEGGFRAREDLWGLLTTVAVGGEISLNGPRYPNPKCYKPDTMRAVFMRTERTLALALMTAVFCKEVPYGGSPISIQEIQAKFEFDTKTAFRCATLLFHAENESPKDLYRITIEGTGNDLYTHRFTFEPSLTWLCRRFPDKSRVQVTVSTGEALNSDSQGPTQHEAKVGHHSCCRGERAVFCDLKLKSKFVSNSGDLCRCVVQNPTRTRPFKKGSKSMQQPRASARLARKSAAEVCTGPPRPPSL